MARHHNWAPVRAAERPVGEFLHSQDVPLHFLGWDGRAGEKTESPGITAARHQFRVSHPAHRGLYDGVFAAQALGQACVQRAHGLASRP